MSYYAFHDHNFCQSIEFSDQSTFIACHNMFKVKLCRRNIKLSPKHIAWISFDFKNDLLWFVASCHHNHFKSRRKNMFNAWCKHGKWPYHYLNKWAIVLWYNRSLKYFCYYMISAVNLQPFIEGESQIATMQTFVLIIMSYPSYRRHTCLYLFTRRPRPQVSTLYRVHFRFPWLVSGDMSQQHVLGIE